MEENLIHNTPEDESEEILETKILEDDEDLGEDEETPKLTINYDINIEEYEKGFVTFQNRYVRPKNIITSTLFGIIAILYIEQIIKDPKYALAWMMIGICIAFIFMVWFNARKIRKNLIKAIKGLEDDKYIADFYNSYIKIKTILPVNEENEYEEEIPESMVNFDYDKVSVLDSEIMYIIYQKKRVYYQIPKRCLSEDEINFMNNYFSRKAGKEFIKLK